MTADETVALAFLTEHPDDAARVVERADAPSAAAMLTGVPAEVRAQIFSALGPAPGAACAAALSDEAFADIVRELDLPRATAAMRRLDPSRREGVLAMLDPVAAETLRRLVSYPDHSAGAVADPLALALAEDISVTEAQRRLRGSTLHLFYYVYILSREGVLTGVLNVGELMTARPRDTLAAIMRRDLVTIDAHTPLATVAALPAWRDFDALPVVDAHGHFIGAIRHKAVRQVVMESGRPMMDTIVQLSELYWVGLAGMLRSLAVGPSPNRPVEPTVTGGA